MNDQNAAGFYYDLFVQNPMWNKPYPNHDEAIRFGKILQLITDVTNGYTSAIHDPIRIVDVGCGRGWLTALMQNFGTVVGIEPVEQVVSHARNLFPNMSFLAVTPGQYSRHPDFFHFDIVICSEVVEHIHRSEQQQFIKDLASLLKPNGHLILSTPRGELFSNWKRKSTRMQPVEDWLTEEQLNSLFESCDLQVLRRERCLPTKLYSHPLRVFHKQPFQRLFSWLGYSIDRGDGMIYQVVLAEKI
ncbi:MAG: methyltransferase domain-containing protein [Anaerolineales bacterium]|nr:methyltransferase domain-containing protein [Anaerolineales bacterium]